MKIAALIFVLVTVSDCAALMGGSHTEAQVLSGIQSGVIHAEYFGVRCDGRNGTDVTAPLQNAINAARRIDSAPGANLVGVTVRLPAGECLVSNTINVSSFWGLTVEGAGPRSTTLWWPRSSPKDRPMFNVYDCRNCTFRRFGVLTSSADGVRVELESVFRVSNDANTSDVLSSANRFIDLDVNGTNGAINVPFAIIDGPGAFPANASNNEFHVFERVRVANFAKYGFQIGGDSDLIEPGSGGPGSTNYKWIKFREVECSCNGADACVYNYVASFVWDGGAANRCTFASFRIDGTGGPVTIKGADSENSARFLWVGSSTGAPRAVNIWDSRGDANTNDYNPDGCFIFLGGAGPHTIVGGQFGRVTLPVGVCHAPGGSGPVPSVTMIGTLWRTTLDGISETDWCSNAAPGTCQPITLINTLRQTSGPQQPLPFPNDPSIPLLAP